MEPLSGKLAVVTGASRGIGAITAQILARKGADIVVNYRNKNRRAEEVAATIRAMGRQALAIQADLTERSDLAAMFDAVGRNFGHLDILILNASGGLEKEMPADYAMHLNHAAQLQTVDLALPLMGSGGRIVFVTSHLAHFYGSKPVFAAYEQVAASKRAGEDSLRARARELADRGVSLVVVSGDLIEGTITPRLLDRHAPGLIEARRQQVGILPSVEEFASAIAEAASDPALEHGTTVFVGSTEW